MKEYPPEKLIESIPKGGMKQWRRPAALSAILLIVVIVLFSFHKDVVDEPHVFSRKFAIRTPFAKSAKYLSSDLAAPNRLGNHLFEFASLYGIANRLGRTPVFWIEDDVYAGMLSYTRQIVPGLVDRFTVIEGKAPVNQTTFHEKCCTFDDPKRLEDVTDEYLHLSGHFYQSWKYFPDIRDEMLSYLRAPKLFSVLPKSDENTFVTCVHARRGDFAGVGFYAADEKFIAKALEFLENRQKHKTHLRLLTVLFGDDPDYLKGIFKDTVTSDSWERDVKPTTKHFVSRNSPPEDLLYSSQHCDSVLISAPVSTFGWWIGYLSKGNDVFYLDVRTVNDGLYKSGKFKIDDFYLPKWTSLKMSNDNSSVVESEN